MPSISSLYLSNALLIYRFSVSLLDFHNTVLSNFALIGREDILVKLFKDTLFTTEEVIAISRDLKVLTDDKDARTLAQRREVPVSGTIGVLVEAVRERLLSFEEANTMLSVMIEKGYFSPFETLDELI